MIYTDATQPSQDRGCPDVELLARAAERGVEAGASAALVEHLAECADCRSIVAAVALDAHDEPAPALRPPHGVTSRPARRNARVVSIAASIAASLAALTVVAAPFVFLGLRQSPAPSPRAAPETRGVHRPAPGGPSRRRHTPRRVEPSQAAVDRGLGRVSPSALPEAAGAHRVSPRPALRSAPTTPQRSPERRPTARPPRGARPHRRPEAAASSEAVPAGPSSSDLAAQERVEELFVEGVFHHQSRRYEAAVRSFDRMLALSPEPALAAIARRWRAKSAAEVRGECQPGFTRRRVTRPAPGDGSGQGPTYLDECVPLHP